MKSGAIVGGAQRMLLALSFLEYAAWMYFLYGWLSVLYGLKQFLSVLYTCNAMPCWAIIVSLINKFKLMKNNLSRFRFESLMLWYIFLNTTTIHFYLTFINKIQNRNPKIIVQNYYNKSQINLLNYVIISSSGSVE